MVTHGTVGSDGGVALEAGALPLAARLSVMVLLEFVAFGAWFAVLGLVLEKHGLAGSIGPAYLLSAVAAIVSPLCLGALGDRFFASQKVLAVAHLVGGALMLGLPAAVDAGRADAVLGLILCYMLAFMPTLGLVNSIALRHLPNKERLFPYVRVFAPLGWVLAGVIVGAAGYSASTNVFLITAGVSFALAVYSLTLPDTPPASVGASWSFGDLIGADAFVLFRDRSFTVLMVCTLLTSIALGVYNTFASPFVSALGITNVAGVLAIGQTSEIVFIVTIPTVLRMIGMKWALLIGMGMWGVRFLLFVAAAQGQVWLAIVGIGLHGICNDFFLVIAAMFVDRIAPRELAAQAQGWLILVISGFGAAIGSSAAGLIFGSFVAPALARGPSAWDPLWYFPIGTAALTAVVWVTMFRAPRSPAAPR